MLYKHTDEDEEETEEQSAALATNPWHNQFQQQQQKSFEPESPSTSETSVGNGSTTDRFGLHTYAVKPPPDSNDSGLFNRDDSQSNQNDEEQEQPSPSSGQKSPIQRIRHKLKFMRGGLSTRGGLPLGNDEDDNDSSKRNSNRHDANGMPLRIPEPPTASSSMLDYVKKVGFSKAGRRASVA
jgi:hypothetical protein